MSERLASLQWQGAPILGSKVREGHEPKAVIEGLQDSFPADAIEVRIQDHEEARRLIGERRPDVLALFAQRRALLGEHFGEAIATAWDRAERALALSLVRLAVRHGRFGSDYHDYHNEMHALEILDRRIGRVMREAGPHTLAGMDWIALSLFASCHDLRQREVIDTGHPVGSNEAASIAETHRILDACGFDRLHDRGLYLALEIMIAGSTFDARPQPLDRSAYNTAEVIHAGGPLAPHLASEMERRDPHWREQPDIERALDLALLASDLDTANVGESFIELCDSSARLAGEREMRAGRSLDSVASGAPMLGFVTGGQERYFFDLHRFCSPLGEQIYAAGKAANASKVREMSSRLRAEFDERSKPNFSGADVLRAQQRVAWDLQ